MMPTRRVPIRRKPLTVVMRAETKAVLAELDELSRLLESFPKCVTSLMQTLTPSLSTLVTKESGDPAVWTVHMKPNRSLTRAIRALRRCEREIIAATDVQHAVQ